MSIPAFPHFAALELAHQPVIARALKDAPPETSEYTFTNLFSWRTVYGFSVSMCAGQVLLRSVQSGRTSFFEPCGPGDTARTIRTVAAVYPHVPWVRVAEATAAFFLHDPGYVVAPDEANADYVYITQELVALAGRKYDGKRNLIKNFKLRNAFEYVELDESHAQECLSFQADWCAIKDCGNDLGLSNEYSAIKEMLAHCDQFTLIAGGIRVGEKMCALAIAESLNPQTLVMHVLKADPRLPGLYQTMLNEFLAHHVAAFAFVNLEQDLGIEGLRTAKRSYHPCRMVNKFTLQPVAAQ